MRDIYLYGVVVAVTAILLMSVGAEWMVKLVSGSSEPVVLENGARYLVWNAPFYAVLGMLLSTRYALQSMGEKVLPLLSSVIEFLGKIIFVLLFIPRFEYNAVILCEPQDAPFRIRHQYGLRQGLQQSFQLAVQLPIRPQLAHHGIQR